MNPKYDDSELSLIIRDKLVEIFKQYGICSEEGILFAYNDAIDDEAFIDID